MSHEFRNKMFRHWAASRFCALALALAIGLVALPPTTAQAAESRAMTEDERIDMAMNAFDDPLRYKILSTAPVAWRGPRGLPPIAQQPPAAQRNFSLPASDPASGASQQGTINFPFFPFLCLTCFSFDPLL